MTNQEKLCLSAVPAISAAYLASQSTQLLAHTMSYLWFRICGTPSRATHQVRGYRGTPSSCCEVPQWFNLKPSTPQPLNPSNPQPLNPSTPQPLNPSTPQPLNPSTPQPLNPSTPQPSTLSPKPPTAKPRLSKVPGRRFPPGAARTQSRGFGFELRMFPHEQDRLLGSVHRFRV